MGMKRLTTFFAALLLAGAGAIGAATPAQASSVYGCPDAYICFFNWQSFMTGSPGGGVWKIHVQNTYQCYTMPSSGVAGWTNGTTYNATTSLIVNSVGLASNPGHHLAFYDNHNCTNDLFATSADQYVHLYDKLGDYGWNDRIGSVKWDGQP